jgi:hypothetical protein
LGPLPPTPPFAYGFGFTPGVHTSPRGRGPPWVRSSRPTSRLLPSFQPCFPRTGGQGPELPALLPCFQEAGLPLYFQGARLPVVSGPCGHAFRRQGFQASMLSGGQTSRCRGPGLPCFQAFRPQMSGHPPCFSPLLSGDHAARLSGFFLTSRPAFMLSGGFQGLSGGHASMLSGGPASWRPGLGFQGTGDQGPGPGLPALTSHT